MAFIPDFEVADPEPLEFDLLPARPKLREPALTILVNRLDPDTLDRIRRPVTQLLGGARANSAAMERAQHEQLERYVRKVIAGWRGATAGNLDYFLRRANRRVGKQMAIEIAEAGGEAPFTVDLAVALLKQCWSEDFDQPVFRFAKYGAEQVEEEREGKESA